MIDVLKGICTEKRGVDPVTLEKVLVLAIEIAREGREGRKVGTFFVFADSENVLKNSRPLILDPLWHHPVEERRIENAGLRETVKELAQLDGAFIISEDGVFLSACRYINASSEGIELPLGLGSRHVAAASITSKTKAIAIVVSESSVVRVFEKGRIIAEILPEVWLLQRFSLHLKGPYSTETGDELAVVSEKE